MQYKMHTKLLFILSVILAAGFFTSAAQTQEQPLDTIYNPTVIYSAIPKKYEIAGISVKGRNKLRRFCIDRLFGFNRRRNNRNTRK